MVYLPAMIESPVKTESTAATPPPDLAKKAVELTQQLLEKSRRLETPSETRSNQKLAGLMNDEPGKELTFCLTDQVFRPSEASRSAELFRSLVNRFGIPEHLSPIDRLLMKVGAVASRFAPSIVMPAITRRLRAESRDVILPADPAALTSHIRMRKSQGAGINLNLLGEAVLGEEEAHRRLEQNLEALTSGTAIYLSLKLSSIFAEISLTAPDSTRGILADRLRLLYRAALGQSPAAFINLDMEEYRDLHLTIDVFKSVLSEPEFHQLRAGIVLQAYLPDTHPVQIELTEWARQRVKNGGAPIKVRIVKGANLAKEQADAAICGWPQAPYLTKAEVDANYLRMLDYACLPENAQAAHVGVATHNLFNVAYALILREHHGVSELVELEMLEGMAASQARAALQEAGSLLFYAPVVKESDFNAAIAYLIRRLDENTTPGNFLHDLFEIAPGNAAWTRQRDAFLAACAAKNDVSTEPQRLQNRLTETPQTQDGGFQNTPDTDFSLPQNQSWLKTALEAEEMSLGIDFQPTEADIEHTIATAANSDWHQTSREQRASLLKQAAVELARSRACLIGEMNREANKAPAEADVEISEAIDFANYYAHSFSQDYWNDGLEIEAIGPVLITPPWNFPCAIPCGGILAALAAGNPVIIKPAPETVRTARIMVECLWRAGIPRHALQFIAAPDNDLGRRLITDPRIASIILTGSSQTAELFLTWRPDLHLCAETSGKNALIITAAADPDGAIKDLVRSAFHHSGQKCSAASIALIEKSLLADQSFLERLRDAATSLHTGPATDPASVVTPLIQAPSENLLRGLTQLDPGESWLLKPTQPDPTNPCLWTPGIRLGVRPDSWVHRSELFGPVLSIIAFDSLDQAIEIQNSSALALTGGIHSLDPEEIALWKSKVEIGNAYINRPITGAIVQRQPFGGWKASSIGPGAKAGGSNYVAQFAKVRSKALPKLEATIDPHVKELLDNCLALAPSEDHATLRAAAQNAAYWFKNEFAKEHDPSNLAPESNHFRYRPVPEATLRFTPALSLSNALITTLMAATAQVAITWSSETPLPEAIKTVAEKLGIKAITETPAALKERLTATPCATLRSPGIPMLRIHSRNHSSPITPHARLELLPYFLEQSVSETRHRHGRLI